MEDLKNYSIKKTPLQNINRNKMTLAVYFDVKKGQKFITSAKGRYIVLALCNFITLR